jgi:hypothetical protein
MHEATERSVTKKNAHLLLFVTVRPDGVILLSGTDNDESRPEFHHHHHPSSRSKLWQQSPDPSRRVEARDTLEQLSKKGELFASHSVPKLRDDGVGCCAAAFGLEEALKRSEKRLMRAGRSASSGRH